MHTFFSVFPGLQLAGFSKGLTQAGAYRTEQFENVPFKGMRSRMTEMFRSLELLSANETIDTKMCGGEDRFAFGSLVRCSLARRNDKGALECTGAVMPRAFSEEIFSVTRACAETWLTHLPTSVRLVLMLGTTDSYIKNCKALLRAIHPETWSDINEVSYRVAGAIFVHVSHPSGLNGHHRRRAPKTP